MLISEWEIQIGSIHQGFNHHYSLCIFHVYTETLDYVNKLFVDCKDIFLVRSPLSVQRT